MKFKFFNLLTVCLATSGLLAPAQSAFGDIVEPQMNTEPQHFVCVKQAQHFVCDLENSGKRDRSLASNQGSVNEAKATESLNSSNVVTVVPSLTPTQQESVANIFIWLTYLLPLGLGLGLFLYDKYWAYRSAVLHKQIDLLERLWQYSSDNDATPDTERGARG